MLHEIATVLGHAVTSLLVPYANPQNSSFKKPCNLPVPAETALAPCSCRHCSSSIASSRETRCGLDIP